MAESDQDFIEMNRDIARHWRANKISLILIFIGVYLLQTSFILYLSKDVWHDSLLMFLGLFLSMIGLFTAEETNLPQLQEDSTSGAHPSRRVVL